VGTDEARARRTSGADADGAPLWEERWRDSTHVFRRFAGPVQRRHGRPKGSGDRHGHLRGGAEGGEDDADFEGRERREEAFGPHRERRFLARENVGAGDDGVPADQAKRERLPAAAEGWGPRHHWRKRSR